MKNTSESHSHFCLVISIEMCERERGAEFLLIDGNNFIRQENGDQFLIRLGELHGKSKWLSLFYGAKVIDYPLFPFHMDVTYYFLTGDMQRHWPAPGAGLSRKEF